MKILFENKTSFLKKVNMLHKVSVGKIMTDESGGIAIKKSKAREVSAIMYGWKNYAELSSALRNPLLFINKNSYVNYDLRSDLEKIDEDSIDEKIVAALQV